VILVFEQEIQSGHKEQHAEVFGHYPLNTPEQAQKIDTAYPGPEACAGRMNILTDFIGIPGDASHGDGAEKSDGYKTLAKEIDDNCKEQKNHRGF